MTRTARPTNQPARPTSPPPRRPSLPPWPNPRGHQPSGPARRVAPLPTPDAADIPVPSVSPLLHPLPLTAGPHLSAGAVSLSPWRGRRSPPALLFPSRRASPSPLHDRGPQLQPHLSLPAHVTVPPSSTFFPPLLFPAAPFHACTPGRPPPVRDFEPGSKMPWMRATYPAP